MRLYGMNCPHCNSPLGDIEDGRVNFFCSYCGSSLSLDIENDEVKKIVEIKRAETELTNAKANYLGQDARHIEAETDREKYRDSKKENNNRKEEGKSLVFWGIVIIAGSLVLGLLSYLLLLNYENLDSFRQMLLCVFAIGALAGVSLVGKGYKMYFAPVGQAKIALENKKRKLEVKIDELEKEAAEQRDIIGKSGGLIGKQAAQRRGAQDRLKIINSEIISIKNEITIIDKKLDLSL